jgi:hypothetical protein
MTGSASLSSRFATVLAVAWLAAACTTLPADPDAPTPEEQALVETARSWCRRAGEPAGPTTRPFYSDGCSAWPDGALYGCCVEHDIAYWCGGSEHDRCEADRRFRACAEVFDPGQAGLVYRGVRIGGVPWLPTPWRWGYGHAFGTGYVDRRTEHEDAPHAPDAKAE